MILNADDRLRDVAQPVLKDVMGAACTFEMASHG